MGTAADSEESVLWIGPGQKLGQLAPLLAALPARGGLRALAEIADLGGANPPSGALLIEADVLRAEDLLDLERFLARVPTARLILIGEDPGRRGVRALLRGDRVRWMAWPPDLEDMRALAAPRGRGRIPAAREEPARERRTASSSRADTDTDDPEFPPELPATRPSPVRASAARLATTPAAADEERKPLGEPPLARPRLASPISAEIAEIERVLGALSPMGSEISRRTTRTGEDLSLAAHLATHAAEPHASSRPHAELPPLEAEERGLSSTSRGEPEGSASSAHVMQPARAGRADSPPESFRAQVADLADIAQRIEFSLQGLREAHEESSPPSSTSSEVETVGREVARLVQFARTLGYLVSPPGPGVQRFELTEMLEVFLSEIRSGGPDAPRCLLRSNGPLLVRSDRQLLSQAFDALFFLARSAAARGEIVRVQARRDEDSEPPTARISIDFPAGRLLEVPTEAIVEPYRLRRILPDLGPNALSAAVRIIEGQGGQCRLEPQSRGRLEWTVTLPLAGTDGEAIPHGLVEKSPDFEPSLGGESSRAARAEDPFA